VAYDPDTPESGSTFSHFWAAVTLYFCAAFGGFMAAVADIMQKEEASAVMKMTSLSAQHLAIQLSPVWILAGLTVSAIALCLVFQPKDRKQSFTVGAGVIAFVMTVTPYRQPETGVPEASATTTIPASSMWAEYLQYASSSGQGSVTEPGQRDHLNFVVYNNSPADAVVGIWVNFLNQEYYQKNSVSAGSRMDFRFQTSELALIDYINYAIEVDGQRMPLRTILSPAEKDDLRISATLGPSSVDVSEFSGKDSQFYTAGRPRVLGAESPLRTFGNKIFRPYKW
jgi:hypothetical protein